VLRLERISKIFPNSEVLKDVTWEIKHGDKIGLVGVNGAGKSTQLKIIAGLIEPSSGNIIKQGDIRIAFLKQEFDVDPNRTVRDELFQAFDKAAEIVTQQNNIQLAMSSQRSLDDSDYLNGLIKELSNLQIDFEAIHGYELEAEIDKLLPKIGFSREDSEQSVSEFSGGWQMRIALGKILLQKPDLLLLDEPTNHLDLETIEWLERYLIDQRSAMVIISHDRTFLDKICTQIVNTERGISRLYIGNYTSYLEQSKLEKESLSVAFERQQKEIAEQQAYIDRFRASATRSTQAKSREKSLDKLERVDAPLTSINQSKFRFPPAPRSGKQVLLINDLTHGYGNKILFLGASLEVEPGDRIAFLGPNGSGKSTLLRLVMNIESPDDGSVQIGPHNVFVSYFAQNQAEALDLQKTVIETMFEAVPDWNQTQIRSLLGSLSLTKESVYKFVKDLSGGEKARLALALMLVKPSNLLVLDEPTNHLDIPAKEMLEDAINDYTGAALIVSHDRYFISKVANKIIELKDGELKLYRGDYSYFLEKKKEEERRIEHELDLAKKEAKRLENKARQRNRKINKRNKN
tara:strand:- start:77 stop:1801 length:1725 start_codon:yes stop_codon:yes gene_type:complete